jgi:hypothetical protein
MSRFGQRPGGPVVRHSPLQSKKYQAGDSRLSTITALPFSKLDAKNELQTSKPTRRDGKTKQYNRMSKENSYQQINQTATSNLI